MASVSSSFRVVHLQSFIALLSLYCIWNVNGSAPISDFEDTSVPEWYPYNLIETDVSCYKVGPPYCPMFPPGGPLSVFPNSEEKFQHALHNMHRQHWTENLTNITGVDIARWWGGGWAVNTFDSYYSRGDYCGRASSIRKPLYWYSDANAAARLKAWDEHTCLADRKSAHDLCDEGSEESMWSYDGYIDVPTDRCSLFNGCGYASRSAILSVEDGDNNKEERPWFYEEGICGGNSCFQDSHCDPIFAAYNDYVGNGFMEGSNGVTAQYSRFTYEIQYELPIGAHYDDRMKTKPIDRDGDGKFFALILQYFHEKIPAGRCWALYEDTFTEMDILLDDAMESGRSQFFRSKYYPPDNCRPYKFICRKSDGSYVKLPEEDTYYFGTQMMEWKYTLDPNDGVDGVDGVTLASLAGGYDCEEQHYYYTETGWIVNGGPTLTETDRIWYYHNGGTCRGCQYIPILECWLECIESDFDEQICGTCDDTFISPTNAPTTPTLSPTSPAPTTPTLSPTDPTEAPSKQPTVPTLSPTTSAPTAPTIKTTDSPTNEPTTNPTITARQCPGLDLAITLYYIFEFNEIQRKCDICLYETLGNENKKECERIASFLDIISADDEIEGGIRPDFSNCMLNVCNYGCTLGELQLNEYFDPDGEPCGCNVFVCKSTQGSSAYRPDDNVFIISFVSIVFVTIIIGWI